MKEYPWIFIGVDLLQRSRPNVVTGRVSPPDHFLDILTEGQFSLIADGRTFFYAPGEVRSAPVGTVFSEFKLLTPEILFYRFRYRSNPAYRGCFSSVPGYKLTVTGNGRFSFALERLLALRKNPAPEARELEQHFACDLLFSLLETPPAPGESAPPIYADPVMQKLDAYLRKRITRRVTLEDLMREIGTSRTSLHDKCVKATGKAPMEYMESLRMERARQLLTHTSYSGIYIATHCGYHSLSYFNRIFRRAEGISPKAYRQKMQKK